MGRSEFTLLAQAESTCPNDGIRIPGGGCLDRPPMQSFDRSKQLIEQPSEKIDVTNAKIPDNLIFLGTLTAGHDIKITFHDENIVGNGFGQRIIAHRITPDEDWQAVVKNLANQINVDNSLRPIGLTALPITSDPHNTKTILELTKKSDSNTTYDAEVIHNPLSRKSEIIWSYRAKNDGQWRDITRYVPQEFPPGGPCEPPRTTRGLGDTLIGLAPGGGIVRTFTYGYGAALWAPVVARGGSEILSRTMAKLAPAANFNPSYPTGNFAEWWSDHFNPSWKSEVELERLRPIWETRATTLRTELGPLLKTVGRNHIFSRMHDSLQLPPSFDSKSLDMLSRTLHGPQHQSALAATIKLRSATIALENLEPPPLGVRNLDGWEHFKTEYRNPALKFVARVAITEGSAYAANSILDRALPHWGFKPNQYGNIAMGIAAAMPLTERISTEGFITSNWHSWRNPDSWFNKSDGKQGFLGKRRLMMLATAEAFNMECNLSGGKALLPAAIAGTLSVLGAKTRWGKILAAGTNVGLYIASRFVYKPDPIDSPYNQQRTNRPCP